LQNLLCGSSADAKVRRQQLLQRGLLRHVAVAAAHSMASTQSLAAQETAQRMRLDPWKKAGKMTGNGDNLWKIMENWGNHV
jgi:hypothetical protein